VALVDGTEMSVRNYHCTLRNVPAERRSHLHLGGSMKSRIASALFLRGFQMHVSLEMYSSPPSGLWRQFIIRQKAVAPSHQTFRKVLSLITKWQFKLWHLVVKSVSEKKAASILVVPSRQIQCVPPKPLERTEGTWSKFDPPSHCYKFKIHSVTAATHSTSLAVPNYVHIHE
jgi:hypothetical protein